ncbi:aldo/keto reductase [Flavobacterium sp.]|jgi:aryl-alcohol dehydrogenase-like predicted oxidoreductase|uniref:aldo/keto reductase n=1 Tax=Flavobacterium sp. TaxID=239 RepID=UPI0037BE7441
MQKIILGTVQFGLNYGINNSKGKPSSDECFEILNRSFDFGITNLDTAEAYGDAHKIIGDFHKLNPLKKFKIITKIPHGVILDDVQSKVEQYLKDLEIESIEVLMFHSYDTYIENYNNTDKFESFINKGFIKSIGVSVYTNEQIDSLLADKRITVVQLPFNLFDNVNKRGEVIEKLKLSGKMVHTRSPFLQGLFFKETNNLSSFFYPLKEQLEKLNELSEKYNVSISKMALAYSLKQNNIDQVLIGIDSIKQLEDNFLAFQYQLDEKLMSEINAITIENDGLLNPALWK